MEKKVVKITNEESCRVGALYYDYNAEVDIIGHILSNPNNKDNEVVQGLIISAKKKFVELEMLKNEIVSKYNPFNNKSSAEVNYYFDFVEDTIVYSI